MRSVMSMVGFVHRRPSLAAVDGKGPSPQTGEPDQYPERSAIVADEHGGLIEP